jgi:hypothetical protein
MIRPDMAQLDIEAHQERVARDVRRLLFAFSLCIIVAVCIGIGAGWVILGRSMKQNPQREKNDSKKHVAPVAAGAHP